MTSGADTTGFVALVTQYAPILRKVSASYATTAADRRDLMQEITLQLWKAYPRYDPARSFSTWMYRIALNVAISYLRGPGHPARQTLSLEALNLDPAGDAPADRDDDGRVELLRRAIARLDSLSRALMILYLDDRSYREIADVLGISESNVGTKIARLKERVRQDIAREQGDDHGAR